MSRCGSRRVDSRAWEACGLSILVLLVSWSPVTTNCRGGAMLTPIDHYELKIFEMRVIGMSGDNPIYLRSFSRSTTTTSADVDPPVGGVVGWDNMWSGTWTIQNPPVIAVSMAGNRSGEPCP
ncbi:MAG TPA: hypothetical protein VGS03_07105 [Candidatus Polarisedimenticolia bacterium]|nr:hypothetical protein [Candidatus Polarisedimenticolia bacterium]